MPGAGDSGLLVVRLPLRSASEQIRDKLSSMKPEAELPRSASAIFSLANLANLSRDRFDPPAKDSAVTFLRALAPPRPGAVALTVSDSVLPPPDLMLSEPRRLRVLPVLAALAIAGVGFGATLGLVGGQPPARPTEVVDQAPAVQLDEPVEPPAAALPEEEPPAPAVVPSTTALDRRQLERVMDRLRFRVRRCFKRHHRRGRARVRVTVLASGEPRDLRVRTGRAGRSVAACIRRQVRQSWFPPIGAPSMDVSRSYRAR